MTYDELVTATGYSYSAVRAARKVLGAVALPEDKSKRDGACGKFPTLWALPRGKRR